MSNTRRDADIKSDGWAAPVHEAGHTICVLKGSSGSLNTVPTLLQHDRYNVTTTTFGPRTLEVVEHAHASLLIIDLRVGEQAGWNHLARLRHAVVIRGIRVLFISDMPQLWNTAREKHRPFRGDQCLIRPYDRNDLRVAVESLVGTS